MNHMGLRGLVFSRYRTISEFAEALGWHRNKASRVLNGQQEPDIDEMKHIATILEMSAEVFINIFFDGEYTMCTSVMKG